MPERVDYQVNGPLTTNEFLAILESSTLAERRPVNDRKVVECMVANADLTVTARAGGRVVGVARSVTDFAYACYLSDLAVDVAMQGRGVGRELIRLTREQLGPRCSLILLAAPAAVDYYPRIGLQHHPQAWVLRPGDEIV